MNSPAAGCVPSRIGDPIRNLLLTVATVVVLVALLTPVFARATSWKRHPRKHVVPRLWVADAVCETGRNPPNWRFHVGIYQGGIAFYYGTWDSWKQHVPAARGFGDADQAPAWVQAAVAQWGLEHFGRWGCLFNPAVWQYAHG